MLIATLSYRKFEFLTLQREKSAAKSYKHAASSVLKFCRSRIS